MIENTNKFLLSNDVREYLMYNSSYVTMTTATNSKLFSCYDDYYCSSDSLANTGHVLLGVVGLIMSLMGLALNVLLIPVLSLVGIRSSATYYMIGMAISDCCLLIINVMLVVIRYLPNDNQTGQLFIYQNFVAYLIPFGLPLKQLCQTLSTSLCTCLILDRFVYSRTEKKLNTAKRAVAVKVMITIVTLTIIFKLPNFFVYKIVENSVGVLTVKWTLLAKPWIFIVDTAMFAVVYTLLVGFTCIMWHVAVTCHFLPKVFLLVKISEVHYTERFQRRERLYIVIAVLVAMSTVIVKFSQLLRNIFFGFFASGGLRDLVQMQRLSIAELWMESLDLVLIVIKPCIYIVFAVHFRQALKDMIGLWVRPSRYTIVKASGGMGKLIDLRTSNSDINRSDTSNSLLKSYNYESRPSVKSPIDIEALAIKQVYESGKISTNNDSSSSAMSVGSSASVISTGHSVSKERLRF